MKPEDKAGARQAAVEAVAEPWPMPVAIRINGVGSEWHSTTTSRRRAIRKADLVVVPRADSADASVRDVGRRSASRCWR